MIQSKVLKCRVLVSLAAATVCSGLVGCQRHLTITQDTYINTAMHVNRPKDKQTGEPLEVHIVSVYPDDLKNTANSRLAPGNAITSDVWFQDCPQPGDRWDMPGVAGTSRFQLPPDQIFLLTDDRSYYGSYSGPTLHGAAVDGTSPIKRKFKFGGPLHNKNSVIYVFPKFIGADGRVLPVPPAKFDPPGAYSSDLSVHIGVDESRPHYGQYIKIGTDRRLHGKR